MDFILPAQAAVANSCGSEIYGRKTMDVKETKNAKKTKTQVYVVAVLCAVVTGMSFLAAKTSLVYATPLEALFLRFLIGFLFAVIVMKSGIVKVNYKGKPMKRLIAPMVLYSLGFFGFQFFGLLYATSIEASLLFAIMPAFTMIIAEIALKEKPNWMQRFCVFLTLAAVLFLFIFNNGGVGELNPLGAALLLLSTLCMAGNNVAVRWVRNDFTPGEISAASIALGCAVYTLVILVVGGVNGTLGHTLSLLGNWNFMIAAFYLGVGCTMLTTLMNAYLMANLEAVKSSAFGNLGTLISVFAGAVVLHEPLNWVHLVCGAVIILGVLGTNFFKGKEGVGKRNNI